MAFGAGPLGCSGDALLKTGMGRDRRLTWHLSGLLSVHPSLHRDWALQPPYWHLGLCPSGSPGPAHTWVMGLTSWPGGWDLWPPGAAGSSCSLTWLPREITGPGQPLLSMERGSPGAWPPPRTHPCPAQARPRRLQRRCPPSVAFTAGTPPFWKATEQSLSRFADGHPRPPPGRMCSQVPSRRAGPSLPHPSPHASLLGPVVLGALPPSLGQEPFVSSCLDVGGRPGASCPEIGVGLFPGQWTAGEGSPGGRWPGEVPGPSLGPGEEGPSLPLPATDPPCPRPGMSFWLLLDQPPPDQCLSSAFPCASGGFRRQAWPRGAPGRR